MAVRIVQLGSPRSTREGIRIGTVRRPPRGVPKDQHGSQDWYDAWLPELAPGDALVKLAQGSDTPREWALFVKRYRAEMAAPDRARLLRLLAVLSRESNFSVGCYCEDESRCHRSVLRELLEDHGAEIASR